MPITEQELNSVLWKKLTAHLNELLSKAHKQNEKSIGIADTAALRGRIKTLREILKIGIEQNSSATER